MSTAQPLRLLSRFCGDLAFKLGGAVYLLHVVGRCCSGPYTVLAWALSQSQARPGPTKRPT